MDSWLRSLAPAWAARLPFGKHLLFDVALAVGLAVISIAIPLSAEETDFTTLTRPAGGEWLLIIGAAWAVPFRRVFPVAALLVGAVLQGVVWTIGFPDSFVAMAVLLYSAAAYARPRHRIWSWATAVTLTIYTGLGVAVSGVPGYALPLVGLFATAAVATGSTTSAGRAYTEAAESRALELERSRQADRERALADERARIARELHDVVAHGLSVIVVQAAAARRILDRDPEGAATALSQIEITGRNALGEMRHVLSAIRTEPEDSWQPTRGLADLDALVAELDRTGLPVTVLRSDVDDEDRVGLPGQHALGADLDPDVDSGIDSGIDPELDGRPGFEPLPATVDVTAYRIVRESLTNVLKHGGTGARAKVEIIRRPGRLDLRITDDGRGALADDGGGHGLRGMQERVEVFGGRFSAGPRLGGGYTVEANLPLEMRSTSGSSGER